MGKINNLIGKTFTRLSVIGRGEDYVSPGGKHLIKWECVCVCGTKRLVFGESLVSGTTKSCGCLRRENTKKAAFRHGFCTRTKVIPEHKVWSQMKQRCLNPNDHSYSNYGGRGITICQRWLEEKHGFSNFISDLGRRPSGKYSLERTDNDGSYSPENCHWATYREQNSNTRIKKISDFSYLELIAEFSRRTPEYGVDAC